LDKARAVYDSMLLGNADQQARGDRSLGLLAMVEGHYSEAIERFRQATMLSQIGGHELTEARNRLFLASAQQEKGWRDSASAQLRLAHGLFRKAYFEPTFLMYLGKALVRDGQLPLALEVLDSLRRRARADNPNDRANLQVLTAEVALTQGHADSAVRLLSVARATDSSALVKESLANAMARAGEVVPAAQLYGELTSLLESWYGWEGEQPALTGSLMAGALYERAHDLPRARLAYERVLTRWLQGDTDLVTMRASRDALARLQRTSGALTPGAP
jgi:tetratricopeptide (TPR) repeat protein